MFQRLRTAVPVLLASGGLVLTLTPAGAATLPPASHSVTITDPVWVDPSQPDPTYVWSNPYPSGPKTPVAGTFVDLRGVTVASDPTNHAIRVDFLANADYSDATCPGYAAPTPNNECFFSLRLVGVNLSTGAPSQYLYTFWVVPSSGKQAASAFVVSRASGSTFRRTFSVIKVSRFGKHVSVWFDTSRFPDDRLRAWNPNRDTTAGVASAYSYRAVDSAHHSTMIDYNGETDVPDITLR